MLPPVLRPSVAMCLMIYTNQVCLCVYTSLACLQYSGPLKEKTTYYGERTSDKMEKANEAVNRGTLPLQRAAEVNCT